MSIQQAKYLSYKYYYFFVFIAAFTVYANTLSHDFALDDDVVYLKNRFVQNGVKSIPDIISHGFLYGFNGKNDQSYRPLVLIHYSIEHSFFGNNPRALHFINVLYYSLLCVLLLMLLESIFKARIERKWLIIACLVFVVHPIHTEVVANIKGRDEIFHAIFSIATLLLLLKHIDTKKIKYLYSSFLTFFLALLSKEMAITLIAIIPLTIYFFREVELKQNLKLSLYFVGFVLFYFLLRNQILDTIAFEETMTILNNGIAAADSLSLRIATTFYIFGEYLKLLIIPWPLSWDYTYPHFPIVGFNNPRVIITVVLSLIAAVFSIYKLKSKSILAFACLFFIISFSIVSNFFILIGATLGERFLFFPSIALVIALIGLIELVKKNRAVVSYLLIGVIALYSYKTYSRNKDWKNNHALFTAGAEASPNNTRSISALATVYREKGESSSDPSIRMKNFTEAIKNYQRSIQLYSQNSDSWYNLGVTYMNMGDDNKAKSTFQQLLTFQPNHLNALNNLGVIFFREQNFTEAEILYNRAIKVNPNFQNAYANLGAIYHNQGDLRKAEQYYLNALRLNPRDGNTQRNYNKLKLQLGN